MQVLLGRRVRRYNFFRMGRRKEREIVLSSITNVVKMFIRPSSVLINPVPMQNSAVFAAFGVTKLRDVSKTKQIKVCVPQDGSHDVVLLPSTLAEHYNL